ncbi:hypothetical protein [Nocardia caishijiensis]|uniref:Transmembrane protein n=1 Tax=Nocardia caishijiensis TaxID=184756 RepID=A0ABQ6YHM4_9NOCA|nr:hypothetical protein [Nocardia caishijiensis]KAF0845278.1 hypothetical protein FNL39_10886 [Nocardia caishijiensis]
MRTNDYLARIVLLEVSAVRARTLAAEAAAQREAVLAEHAAQAARERADQQQRAAVERRQLVRRILSSAGGLAVLAVPVWVLTPVVGSILSIFSDNITEVVFLSGDTGDTSGSGPWTLYSLLWKLLLGMIAGLATLGFVLPYPRDEEVVSVPAMVGFGGGLLVLAYHAVAGSGSATSWWWPPLFAVLGHLGYGLYRRIQQEQGAQ